MSQETQTVLQHPEFHGRIGVARREITPPVGIYARLWGSATHDVAEGIHRPAYGSCVVFQDLKGAAELVLIALDACVIAQEEVVRIRSKLLSQFDLESHQLTLVPSHSHSIPSYKREHAQRPGGHLIAPYLERLLVICGELVTEARAAAQEAVLSWAYGKCGLAFNRDFIDPANGREVCGLNLLERADDTLLIGRISDLAGKIRATLVNYGCHPVSLGGANRLISPDYVGAMREIVERETPGAICVFLHGASGDLTPRRSYEGDPAVADQNGRELGYAALSVLASMFPPGQQLVYQGIEESGTPLGVWRLKPKKNVNATLAARMVNTKLQLKSMPTRAELEKQLAVATERYQIERIERTLGRRALAGDGAEGDYFVLVWRIGDAFVAAIPSELYSQVQSDLREKFRDTAVLILSLANGTFMYLPTLKAFKREDVYPVRVALYGPGSLEHVTALAAGAIQELRGKA